MKKLFLFCLLLLIGCKQQIKELNIYELSKKIDQIETNSLNIEKAIVGISNEMMDDELIDVSSDISKIMDLTKLKQYVFYQNDENYIFIYETEDHTISNVMTSYFEDTLKKQITASLREKIVNRIEYKYEDFYIYIVSSKQNKILEKILETKVLLFDNTASISGDAIEEKFGIKIENAIVKWSTKLDQEQGYILIENSTDEIEKKCDEYFNRKQNELTGSVLKLRKDNNLIYVVSQDNNKVLEIIESDKTLK